MMKRRENKVIPALYTVMVCMAAALLAVIAATENVEVFAARGG